MRPYLSLVLALLAVVPAAAHFNMLLPQKASARKGETITLTYQWGHPFEHELFDAPEPASLQVLTPDGKQANLLGSLEKTTVKAGTKEVVAYRLKYTPQTRGDHIFLLRTPPIWMEEDQEFLEDAVKVVLHVQAQKGWERPAHPDLEIEPLTRPYGLRPGMVFQAHVTTRQEPLAGKLVEIERYNVRRPEQLPADEHITYTARTDPNGVVTTTLTEPGWWCLTAAVDGLERLRGDKLQRLRRRSTLWVFVDDKDKGSGAALQGSGAALQGSGVRGQGSGEEAWRTR